MSERSISKKSWDNTGLDNLLFDMQNSPEQSLTKNTNSKVKTEPVVKKNEPTRLFQESFDDDYQTNELVEPSPDSQSSQPQEEDTEHHKSQHETSLAKIHFSDSDTKCILFQMGLKFMVFKIILLLPQESFIISDNYREILGDTNFVTILGSDKRCKVLREIIQEIEKKEGASKNKIIQDSAEKDYHQESGEGKMNHYNGEYLGKRSEPTELQELPNKQKPELEKSSETLNQDFKGK